MKRRLLSCLAVFLLLASMALPMALASETEETTVSTEETTEETQKKYSTDTSGSCGKDAAWRLEGHTLTITGSGALDDGCPWEFYKDTIEVLIISGDITAIGAGNFASCNNLRYIDFGSSLKEIGYQAFYSCNALEAIRLPETFRKFGQESFKDCDGLQVVFCDGPMPSFKGNCLYTNHTVTVYYTKAYSWPWEEIERLRSNFGARIYVDMGEPDVLDDYWYNFPKQTAVQETTEPTVPETTVPETTAPMVVTVAETQPVTVPETTIPETTAPSTEEVVFVLESEPLFVTEPEHVPQRAEQPQPKEGLSHWFWVIVAAAGITALLILILVIRMIIHSIRRYDD